MPVHLGLIAAGVVVLLLGAFDLPAAVSRLPIVKAVGEFLERIRRAGGIGMNSGQLLAICCIAGLLAGRLASGISMQLAIVSGVAAVMVPLAILWLRIAGHERRIEREVIARARQLSAHLAAGENLYRSIHQLAGSRDSPVEVAFGKVADEFRFDRPLAQVLGAAALRADYRPLALLLTVMAQLARQGAQGQAAADVLNLVARQIELGLRAREQLSERTRGIAIQVYVVAGAIPLMAVWLWQSSPYRFSVFELPLGRTVLLPFALAMELVGLALLWRWTRPDSL
ncbi:MAG: type II secretion system F family protein [Chloroflexota bacterium]|nr:type II secretion system F family protein [Chloroflexota bacterium]